MKEATLNYLMGLEATKPKVQPKKPIVKRVLKRGADPIMAYFQNKSFVNQKLIQRQFSDARTYVKSDFIIK